MSSISTLTSTTPAAWLIANTAAASLPTASMPPGIAVNAIPNCR